MKRSGLVADKHQSAREEETSLDWCAEQLAQLGLSDAKDFIAECVFALGSEQEVRACLAALLPEQSSGLVDALLKHWQTLRTSADANSKVAGTAVSSESRQRVEPVSSKKLCECGGLEHTPWNNCLCCGRISCFWERATVEEAGRCPFCQTPFQADRTFIAERAMQLAATASETRAQDDDPEAPCSRQNRRRRRGQQQQRRQTSFACERSPR
jgi:hypothetical protein